MKKAVVTYNFGNYEKMPEILWDNEDWDFFAFTDEITEIPKSWNRLVLPKTAEIPYITDFEEQSKRLSNYIKFQPFKLLKDAREEYDLIVVIDANFQISNDLDEACERLLMATADACFMSHPNLSSAYDDIDLNVRLGKLDADVANFTKDLMQKSGTPIHDSQYCQTGFSIRRNTSGWAHFEHIWWEAYNQMCNRDQPVFNALLSKFPVLDLNVVPKEDIDPYLKYTKHSFEKIP